MEALAGTALGALLAIAGGAIVRRWESRRAGRAELYLQQLHPFGKALREAREHPDHWPRDITEASTRLRSAALALSRKDYEFADDLRVRVRRLRAAHQESKRMGAGTAEKEEVAARLRELSDGLLAYEAFLRRKLVGRKARITTMLD